MNGRTKLFVDLIETKFLRDGAGTLSPTYDELARAWQDLTKESLQDAIDFVPRTIDAAIRTLDEDRAWSCVTKVTKEFYAEDSEPDDTDWIRLIRCVAVWGRKAVGVHFHVDGEANCWSWQVAREMVERRKNGIDAAERGRITRAIEAGLQPPDSLRAIVTANMARDRASGKAWRRIEAGVGV